LTKTVWRISMILIVGVILLAGCTGPQKTGAVLATATRALTQGAGVCPGFQAVIQAFYDANDAKRSADSLSLLTPDAEVVTGGEGVNGRHWDETHITGQENIKPVLEKRGFRRIFDQPGAPTYHEADFTISANQAVFFLRPDQLAADGRPHNPYMVTAIFDGCKIRTLEVVERFTAP
jgi:hypothetical protein